MRARTGFSFPQLPALLLYALTIACEVPVILTRMLIALALSVLLLLITGHSTAGTEHLAELGLIPSLWAILALLTPVGGGWWWRQNQGGRRPSERERAAYEDSLELLRSHTSAPLPELRSWFVLDTPQPDAAVAGETLMLSRGLLESDYLAPVLAPELGHLASTDGRLTAALNRLVIHPPRRTADEQIERRNGREAIMFAPDRVLLTLSGIRALAWAIRKTLGFAQGGLGLRITAPMWGAYWRAREYAADRYAAALGQADELADFLEIHALIHDHPVPFIWLTEHTHPPTELRVDRLRKAAHTLPPGATATCLPAEHTGQPRLAP